MVYGRLGLEIFVKLPRRVGRSQLQGRILRVPLVELLDCLDRRDGRDLTLPPDGSRRHVATRKALRYPEVAKVLSASAPREWKRSAITTAGRRARHPDRDRAGAGQGCRRGRRSC